MRCYPIWPGDGKQLACALANRTAHVLRTPPTGKHSVLTGRVRLASRTSGSVENWLCPAWLWKRWLWSVSHVIVIAGHDGAVTSVHFSHSGTWLLTSSTDKTVRLWSPVLYDPLLVLSSVNNNFSSALGATAKSKVCNACLNGLRGRVEKTRNRKATRERTTTKTLKSGFFLSLVKRRATWHFSLPNTHSSTTKTSFSSHPHSQGLSQPAKSPWERGYEEKRPPLHTWRSQGQIWLPLLTFIERDDLAKKFNITDKLCSSIQLSQQ